MTPKDEAMEAATAEIVAAVLAAGVEGRRLRMLPMIEAMASAVGVPVPEAAAYVRDAFVRLAAEARGRIAQRTADQDRRRRGGGE